VQLLLQVSDAEQSPPPSAHGVCGQILLAAQKNTLCMRLFSGDLPQHTNTNRALLLTSNEVARSPTARVAIVCALPNDVTARFSEDTAETITCKICAACMTKMYKHHDNIYPPSSSKTNRDCTRTGNTARHGASHRARILASRALGKKRSRTIFVPGLRLVSQGPSLRSAHAPARAPRKAAATWDASFVD
jgi:hypothetical protein